jgi:tungstate transport system substrate-binding protein
MPIRPLTILGALVALLALSPAQALERLIVVASTTSPQHSGLFGHILPLFKAKTGIDARLGTGHGASA